MTIKKKFVYLQKESLIDKSDLGNARVKISGCGGIIDTAANATGFSIEIIQQMSMRMGGRCRKACRCKSYCPDKWKTNSSLINSR
jgi:hypothetical protein